MEQLLQRRGDELFDIGCRVTREVDIDVGHRDDDLRVLLAGRDEQRSSPQHQGEQNQDQRQVRAQEDAHDRVGEAVLGTRGVVIA